MRKKIQWALYLILSSLLILSPFSQAADILTTAEKTLYNPADQTRAGIEVEFAGLSVRQAATLTQNILGGPMELHQERIKTTLKEITASGQRIYNETDLIEYVVSTPSLGKIVLKPDTNQVNDTDEVLDSKAFVVELVTEPLKGADKVVLLQKVMEALKKAGAIGTKDDLAVSIQMNTEVAEGDINKLNWEHVLNIIRSVYHPSHAQQMADNMNVPKIRRQYLKPLSRGLQKMILDPNYKASGRQLFDDIIYRQSLDLLGFKNAWIMPVEEARNTLLAQKNPIVPGVVKQTRLRVSSLLMWAFPDDPMTKIYTSAGWAVGRPLIEWREWNNDFDVISPYKQALGMIQGAKTYGYYDHDRLVSNLSGISITTVKKLRQKYYELRLLQEDG